MPVKDQNGGRDLRDAARLTRSFTEIYSLLEKAAPISGAFCPGHQVGFSRQDNYNPSLYVRDFSPAEVVVQCWGCDCLFQAPYTIDTENKVTFGASVRVAEKFVPVEGEEITDAVALTDAEVEILDSGESGAAVRLRILSTKANTVINRRVYPMNVLRPAIAKLKPRAQSGQVYAEVPHPKPIKRDGKVVGYERNEAKRVSRIVAVEMNDRGEVWTTHEFLGTAIAKEVAESFIKRSGKYGISQRAIGEMESKTLTGREYPVAKAMELDGYDFVENPALSASISTFEVLLDAELGELAPQLPPTPQEPADVAGDPLTDAGSPASQEDDPHMSDKTKTNPTPAAPAPAQAAAASAITPEQLTAFAETMTRAQAIIEGDAARKAAEQAKAEVATFAASSEVAQAIAGIPEQLRGAIVARVAAAPDKGAAEAILAQEVDHTSRIVAAAKLAATGFGQPAPGAGVTTPTAGGPATDITVVANPTPHLEVARKFGEAYDDFARRAGGAPVDPGLREHNKAFVGKLLAKVEAEHGQALLDSAGALLDSEGGFEAWTDAAVSTSSLWNQPTIATMLLIQQFQDMQMLQFVDGIGPDGFENSVINGQIGSVLKLPVEFYTPPTGSMDLPGYDNGLIVAEDAGIPTSLIGLNWLAFAPTWRRAAAELTKDAAQALKNGPLNYQALARIAYHLVEDKKRRVDRAIAEEMLAVSDEYGAVAVNNEAAIAGNVIANSGGGLLYGNTVTYYAKLIGAGTSGAPALNPVVRKRVDVSMNNAGQVSTSTRFGVTVTGGSTTQVEGYIDANGQIASFPGTAATFAVDYVNGRVLFNAASNINNSTALPTISYTYVTNFDTFNPVVPNGVENAVYYNRLLEQVDKTAALMGSFPRFMAPNLVLGSLMAMTRVSNAQLFYQQASPSGTNLLAATRNRVAERNGVGFAQHNTPWSAGDSRLLLTRLGATKYGVDTPFEIEGPFPTYDANRQIRDTKVIKGSENSVICTPQVVDQSGKTLNPVARSIFLR